MDSLLDALHGSASSWHESKLFIEHLIAICHDTLHLLVGLLVWLLLAVLSRRSIRDWLPLLGTVAIASLNEAVDLWFDQWPSVGQQLGEGARDILATVAVPMLLFAAARIHPSLFELRTRKRK